MASELEYLVYSSEAVIAEDSAESRAMIEAAIARNAHLGITGFLHREEDLFFQCIEGDPEAVEMVFASICRDPRHREIKLLARGPASARRFDGWFMGYNSRNNLSLFDWMAENAARGSDDGTAIVDFLSHCARAAA